MSTGRAQGVLGCVIRISSHIDPCAVTPAPAALYIGSLEGVAKKIAADLTTRDRRTASTQT
jgi:hypothetical protein